MNTLSSTIIEEISIHCRSDPSLAIAYFYFDLNNSSKDTLADAILRSMIKQLFIQCATIPSTLDQLFAENAAANRPPAHRELMSTLKSIIADFRAVYIIFDALDECLERSGFLEVVEEIYNWKLDALHLLATSRKEGYIEESLSGLVSHQVPMGEDLVDGDIRFHVSETLKCDSRFKKFSREEKHKIEATLVKDAHGM
jgi:hypothetical protein